MEMHLLARLGQLYFQNLPYLIMTGTRRILPFAIGYFEIMHHFYHSVFSFNHGTNFASLHFAADSLHSFDNV